MRSLIRAKNLLELYLFRRKWQKRNHHNETIPKRVFPIDKVRVGNYSYGSLDVYTWGADEERLEIGSFVSIASGVKFLLGGNHRVDTLLTFPVKVKFLNEKREAISKGPIVIEDDVWIGMDAMILSGSHIGKGAVIGAKTVVTGYVAPYSIHVGNPGRPLAFRFDKPVIERLQSLRLDSFSGKLISKHRELFTAVLTETILEELLSLGLEEGIDELRDS